MKDFECPNCGAQMDKNDICCKYCGTSNPNYIKPQSSGFFTSSPSSTASSYSHTSSSSSKKSGGPSVGVAILLFIFCWPIAVIYLIVKSLHLQLYLHQEEHIHP